MAAVDKTLARLSKICLALPEAVQSTSHGHESWSVGKKKFAYYLNNHHRDGIVSVCCKVENDEAHLLLRTEPQRFYRPAYIGHLGWLGIRLDLGKVDWEEIGEFVFDSYLAAAPRRLAEVVGSGAAMT